MSRSVDQVWQFFLQDQGPYTVAHISKELSLAPRTVQSAVGVLTTRGKLIRSKQGSTPYYMKKSRLNINLDCLPENVAQEVRSLRKVGLGYPQIVKFLNDRDGSDYTVDQLKKQPPPNGEEKLNQLVALARLAIPITTSAELVGVTATELSNITRSVDIKWSSFEGGTNNRQRKFFHTLELALMKNDVLAYRDLRDLLVNAFPDGVPSDWSMSTSIEVVLEDEEESRCSDVT